MNWSLPDFNGPSNAEEIYKQMCGRNGVDVALVSHGGREEGKGIVENSVVDPPNRDIERTGSFVHCNESVVDPHESDVDESRRHVNGKESIVDGSRRDVNGTRSDARCSVRDFDGKQRIVDPSGGVRSDVTHTIFQLASLARKKFSQHYQPGRKSIFTPETLLEKPESDKVNETDILEDDKIQLLDSLHMQHGRLTNREIAFILAIRAITGSSVASTYICAHITRRPSYLLRLKISKLLVD